MKLNRRDFLFTAVPATVAGLGILSRDGFCDAATRVYAHGHDLNEFLSH